MMSRLFIALAVLICGAQLVAASKPSSDYLCPSVFNPTVNVACNTFTETTECFDRCCKSNGQCFSSACDATFDITDSLANCAGPCLAAVECVEAVVGCKSQPWPYPHCLGHVRCKTPDCAGRTQGAICLIDGVSKNFKVCQAGGGVIGDPQFTGLRGQSYQIHGVSGLIYNIISDKDIQYNSRFVFLNSGDCPIIDGRKAEGCFSHPGSYLGELGLKSRTGEKIHVKTGSAKHGFDEISIDGQPLAIGETVFLAEDAGSVTRNSTHVAHVIIGNWDLVFENSDHYLNQRVRVLDTTELKSAHGMLGQTWQGKTYKNAIKYIEGSVDDYAIRDRSIFGDDFLYNQYN